MEINNVDHIGIAVIDSQKTIDFFVEIFGAKLVSSALVEKQLLTSTMLEFGGNRFEIMESTSPVGVISKFIEKKGEGFHHISLTVSNITDFIGILKKKGIRIIGEDLDDPMLKFAFLHPKDTHGILFEIVERH